ncbi:uncharacterized protein F5891DRAFT_1035962 [Suillus fuscotomentosus]|uniref:DUF6593 domain-containing protein n=1 Tax=Suillus fuscotomentosus TaxID=1912939 RepID=A0AAD4E656_9AGAM|nr:uncharacterized protein F5891DRAFT_1035962 [Suillus fuscotomentosus]KAG1900077.1 hypothetical protein F5891DRAFT_1035962 [Suillus fuscotomentosus]
MTLRLSLAKNDPLQTTFSCPERAIHYTSDTVTRNRPFLQGGSKATTTIWKHVVGESIHVGIIEWPANPNDRPTVVVGSRTIEMIKMGLFTSPEKFQGIHSEWYEWQIRQSRAQLVPLEVARSQACIATFVTTVTQALFRKKKSAALLISPEAVHILDDIVVTFIYFENQWRERERARSRGWDAGYAAGAL